MKSKFFIVAAITLLFLEGCKKDVTPSNAQVKIKIDYLGDGGYYNDNIDGVPQGLTLGVNGPFTVSPDKKYTMTYRANSNYPETSITDWTPTTNRTWVIHCYVLGNYEHIETYPE